MIIRPLLYLDKTQVQLYWQTLYMHDTLRFRLCDVNKPTWSDVLEMIVRMGKNMYHVVVEDEIVCDFMLEGFTGKAAQVHFSMHPNNGFKHSLEIAEYVSDQILNHWKAAPDETYLDTLYGLTPITNRAACIFALKTGFKKIGILPCGIKDRGKIVDAMLSIKETRHGR
jgi:hypothetical protein